MFGRQSVGTGLPKFVWPRAQSYLKPRPDGIHRLCLVDHGVLVNLVILTKFGFELYFNKL